MTGTLKVDQIQNNTGTTALTIGTSGSVTFPNTTKYPFIATANGQTLNDSVSTIVQYNNTSSGAGLDPSGVFDTSNYRMTTPVAGYWWIGASVRCSTMGVGRFDMLIRRNSAGVMGQGLNQQGSNDYGLSAMGIIQCAANDYIDIMVYGNGGSNTSISNTLNTGSINGGSQDCTWFMGYLIQEI